MDKIDMSKHRDDTCHHLLIAAITKVSKKKGDEFMKYWHGSGKSQHTMKLVVDDKYEFSVKKVMEEWNKQLDGMVEREAKQLIENKMAGLWEAVEEATEEISDTMKDLLKKAIDTAERKIK